MIRRQKQLPLPDLSEIKVSASLQWFFLMPFALGAGVIGAIKVWLVVAIVAMPVCFFGNADWEGVMCVAASLLLSGYITMAGVVAAPSRKFLVGCLFVLGIWAVIGWAAWTGWPFSIQVLATESGAYSRWNIAIAIAGFLAAPVSLQHALMAVKRIQLEDGLREELQGPVAPIEEDSDPTEARTVAARQHPNDPDARHVQKQGGKTRREQIIAELLACRGKMLGADGAAHGVDAFVCWIGRDGIEWYTEPDWSVLYECPVISAREYEDALNRLRDDVKGVNDEIDDMVRNGCQPNVEYWGVNDSCLREDNPKYHECRDDAMVYAAASAQIITPWENMSDKELLEWLSKARDEKDMPSAHLAAVESGVKNTPWEIRNLFRRVGVAFYPRMHECREDVELSQGIGQLMVNFCGEYAEEIKCAYGEMLKKLQQEVDTVDIVVAGPSLGKDWPAEAYEPEANPEGLRRHIVAVYLQSMGAMAEAFARTHPAEDKDHICEFCLGLIIFNMIHMRVEDDEDILEEQIRELSDLLGSELGAWIVSTDDEE